MIKVTYILSFVDKSIAFEWINKYIDKNKIELSFVLLNNKNTYIEEYLKSNNIVFSRVNYSGKKDIPKAVIKCIKFYRENKTEVVHAHLFDACIVGLFAAKLVGIKKRIHTRHNATIHHVYHPKAVKYDKLINFLSTKIVAISKNVKDILIELEGVNPKKIILIHHGFKLDDFENIHEIRILDLAKKYGIDLNNKPIIGVISRYIHWKGVQYTIRAFDILKKSFPQAHLILANADGPYKSQIKVELENLHNDSYTEIVFENDLFALYKLFDVFVHVPIDKKAEAFGQTYVESLASGIPSVFTNSGIASDFIINEENALIVPFEDTNEIYKSIVKILTNNDLRDKIIINGKKDISEMFSIEKMVLQLEKLYLD
ncbi:MAG: glycosyltransferase family 4 protein [Flavobacteriia bacterium]|nr:glycosyltransferase family 4 protein [Flavobacteriia bacterium]